MDEWVFSDLKKIIFLRLNEFLEKVATCFPEKGGGCWSKVVRKFSGNSSIFEKTGFPMWSKPLYDRLVLFALSDL